MTTTDELSIIEIVRDTQKYADKIDELVRRTKLWEDAKATAQEEMTKAAKERVDTDNFVNARKAELLQARKEHDDAADEAAKRVKLATDTMAEALKVRDATKAKEANIEARESEIARREKILAESLDGLQSRQQEIDKATDLIRRQREHLAALPQT